MLIFWILLSLVALLLVAALITAAVCFFRIFYSPTRKQTEGFPVLDGEIYEPYHELMVSWIIKTREMPHRNVSIRSFDGLTLRGRYFEHSPDAPIEILFHGYKGSAERDLSVGVARCFALGHSALIVDHRASGESDGHVITFGVLESRDCRAWVDFVLAEVKSDAKIILTGISMGAATVLICVATELPENVVGVLADCGYTSAKEIIQKVIRDMKLPARLLYPFAKLGARLFGGFDLDETSPIEAMKNCRLPVIFYHGDTDDFVPFTMSEENYHACMAEKKRLVRIEGAGHGLCYPVAQEQYLQEARSFFES